MRFLELSSRHATLIFTHSTAIFAAFGIDALTFLASGLMEDAPSPARVGS